MTHLADSDGEETGHTERQLELFANDAGRMQATRHDGADDPCGQ